MGFIYDFKRMNVLLLSNPYQIQLYRSSLDFSRTFIGYSQVILVFAGSS